MGSSVRVYQVTLIHQGISQGQPGIYVRYGGQSGSSRTDLGV